MKIILKYSWMILSVLLLGCSGIDKEHLIGNYYLTAVDYVDEGKDLSYLLESGNFVGVVSSTVFAVGYNEEYIIVKQHPREFPNPPDKTITKFFIVPIKNKVHQSLDENKLGPLTELEFKEKRKELRIPEDLTFTKVFKDLE